MISVLHRTKERKKKRTIYISLKMLNETITFSASFLNIFHGCIL